MRNLDFRSILVSYLGSLTNGHGCISIMDENGNVIFEKGLK